MFDTQLILWLKIHTAQNKKCTPFSFSHFAFSMSQVALKTKAFALIWLKKRTP